MNDLENLQAPHNFGVCASACCTKRFTCLRYIAFAECFPAISVPAYAYSPEAGVDERKV